MVSRVEEALEIQRLRRNYVLVPARLSTNTKRFYNCSPTTPLRTPAMLRTWARWPDSPRRSTKCPRLTH